MESPTPTVRTASFVAHDEREHVLAVFADLVCERGFAQVTLEDVATRAELEPGTVRSYFPTEERCALAAIETCSEQCFGAAAQAFMSTPGDCPLAARAALEAMLRYMAGAPSFVHLIVVEHPRVGAQAASLRRRYMNMFAEFLGPGFAAAGDLPPDAATLSTLIAGGIYELLGSHYIEGRLDQLVEALPAVTYFTVAPFFGLEEARRVASVGKPDVAG